MTTASYHFNVGKIECIAVNDGTLTYTDPAPLHFVNAPTDRLGPALRAYGIQLEAWKEWISPLICLVIKAGEHCILIDTGLGTFDWAPNAGRLLQNLQAEGIYPADIDTVIISHAHGDHIGGTTDSEGRAAFPKARYIMSKVEWDFWTSEKNLSQPEYQWMTPFVQQKLLPIQDRFQLLEQDVEIVPGIHTLFAPGHTPGNMAVVVKSGSEQLLSLGDVIAHPLHVEQPDWYLEPDCQPEQSVRTRRQLLERAAVEHALVCGFHLDFPGLGYVRQQLGNWKWQAIM